LPNIYDGRYLRCRSFMNDFFSDERYRPRKSAVSMANRSEPANSPRQRTVVPAALAAGCHADRELIFETPGAMPTLFKDATSPLRDREPTHLRR
jgi:hypothetical protein